MRELILGIYQGKKHTESVPFNRSENVLSVQPFTSQISGLQLSLKYPDGKKKTIAIYETGVARTIENIGLFESFCFEYETCDKNYFVQIVLN